MATYKESGVDIELGDKCSQIAYQAAKNTFVSRSGMIGEPVVDEGGFSGVLDMGDYYLLQNSDGVGSKVTVAEKVNKFDTLGYDLLAMVADDAVCLGAETISITNTIDANALNAEKITSMLSGLETACLEHKVVIPGGEIAELGNILNHYTWNATALAIVEKDKLITYDNIKAGDKIIGIKSAGFRSNGFTLVRHILEEKFGIDWHAESYDPQLSWGEIVLTPSLIYSSAILEMHGRYQEKSKVELKGITHVTGGGIPGNLPRILKKTGLGANIDKLPTAHEHIQQIINFGDVAIEEAYKTWNMGIGMILISNDFEQIEEICKKHLLDCQIIGEVSTGEIKIKYPSS